MKKDPLIIALVLLVSILLPGCEIIGGIFKAGVWTGVIFVVLIIVFIIYFMNKMNKNK